MERGFTRAEFESRTAQLQTALNAHAIDGVLLTTEPEVRYYSGFFTQFWQSPTRPWFLLVPQTGKPVAVIPAIGEQCMARTWVEDIRCWSSPHPDDDGVSLLADTVLSVCGKSARVGLLKQRETHLRMPLADFEQLQVQMPGVTFADATALVLGQRQLKSEAEIAKIRAACDASGQAFAELPSLVQTGQTDRQIFQRFKRSCMDHGADDVAYLVGAARHNGYDDIISPPSDHPTRGGDVLILDTGCVVDGYFCDYDRNYYFSAAGSVSVDEATDNAYRIVHESIDAALDIARPGKTCADLFHAMAAVLKGYTAADSGTAGVGRMGHGLGMQLTESPSLTDFDHTPLAPGMVLTLEPGLSYSDGRMMVHEENIVIRDNGPQLLTRRAAASITRID